MLFKCKMCGGDIEASSDRTYGTCDSCGSTMTLPKENDERITHLFNRANHFRRCNEFDKAEAAYEVIISESQRSAEAHWGIVLSRYGIEYVEDPMSSKRIPTCHRTQFQSILLDRDYIAALEYAPDGYTRSLYEEEASRISELQKEILAIAVKEAPYDLFICYKENSEVGTRTPDSVLAQDLYYQLVQEGFKVFYARISLEDKLGEKYEPYIFSALSSAKVMLVIGTKPEHFNAIWVKNEWRRFLKVVSENRDKLLIPCYRDMDPYDLPEELSALQAQDMNKIGFAQDLLRGVKKVIQGSEVSTQTGGASIESLLERAFIFLEDRELPNADRYFERVLDSQPRHPRAYMGKLLIELDLTEERQLETCKYPFYEMKNFQKALKYADSEYRVQLENYCAKAVENQNNVFSSNKPLILNSFQNGNEMAQVANKERAYQHAQKALKHATTISDYEIAKNIFNKIIDYKLAKTYHDDCVRLIGIKEEQRQIEAENIYREALALKEKAITTQQLESVKRKLESIRGYKDTQKHITECMEKRAEMIRTNVKRVPPTGSPCSKTVLF